MPDATARCTVESIPIAGQPCLRLRHACGDEVVVALHGAQVLSWVAAGRERLYLSPHAVLDGHSPIRGGIPVCFPQFNQRGPLPKHGFARNLAWQSADSAGPSSLTLRLHDDERSRQWWPQAFEAQLSVDLAPGSLRVGLQVHNPSAQAWAFTSLLHTYLRVDDIAQAAIDGLDGMARWDAVTDAHSTQQGAVAIAGEYDSVFTAPVHALELCEAGQPRMRIRQSPSLASTVVWNPGAALCTRLADMPADGYRHMLCIEAGQIDSPVTLAPGQHWAGWQELSLPS